MERQHRRDAVQGLLHMIDSSTQPAALSTSQQLALIRKHLREHAYYKRSSHKNGRAVLRTERDCQQLLTELASESNLGKLKKAGETLVDVMFRVGSSKLAETVLERYHYKRATFDPASLPGPPPNTNHLPRPRHPTRYPKRDNAISRRLRQRHAPSDDDDDALDDGEDEDFANSTTTSDEIDVLLSLPSATAKQYALYIVLQDIDATKQQARHPEWKYGDNTKQNAALALLINQFSLGYPKNHQICSYTPDSLNKFLIQRSTRHQNPRLKSGLKSEPVYKLGSEAFKPAYVNQLRKSYEDAVQRADRLPYGTLPTISTSAEVFAALEGEEGGLVQLPASDQDNEHEPSGHEIGEISQSSSLTETSSHDTEVTSHDGQPSRLIVKLRHAAIAEKWEPVTVKSVRARPRRPTPTPPTTAIAHVPAASFPDLAKWETAFSDLAKQIRATVVSLFAAVGLPASQVSPYVPSSSPCLQSVLISCFGGNFKSNCGSLRDSGSFTALTVTQSLISALVYQFLLREKLDWQRGLCVQLGWSKIEDAPKLFAMLRDPLQNAIARERHLPRRFAEAILKSADDDQTRGVLPRFMQQFAGRLTDDLTPYIETLLGIAALLNQNETHKDKTWRANFEKNVVAIATSAAELKLKLTSSEIQHCFFWPTPGEHFNGENHKAVNEPRDIVAFTVMPGLRLIKGEATMVLPARVVCCSGEEREKI
ncbi:uncharacterized protein MYCFIDRAFT_197021 [Pseudocercospora fijiensis CIRAD86]|uniref:Uncharacterized protein n=1 Tax=Pseudocercospora fijiensis (strain CIRAD86) TaxID=383855 RepID=M3AAU4_PSEFD|nr:uncharacterized protein MYCFIDRAFT_197021 [Pseudocercospora fijiensis CIRAD86]EME81691.1 hypothetical protein MYCFIDRAFT_197021 [Pseudocercospora fijiensis CIRAD86]